jgi:hypothetical protein
MEEEKGGDGLRKGHVDSRNEGTPPVASGEIWIRWLQGVLIRPLFLPPTY